MASNHVSFLDPIALGVATSRRLNYMARHDLFNNPFFSWLLFNVNAFPVKRDSADKSALKEGIKRLRSGGGLVVFPEGTRSRDGVLFGPQPGIGFIAAKSAVPVIPAFVQGTEKAWPKGAKRIRLGQVSVYFGKQISIEGRMPYQDIAQQIMDNIRHLAC